MKILEAQNALLTNYEVYQFLVERNEQPVGKKGKHGRRRGPGNLETLVTEVLMHLRVPHNPLSQEPSAYSAAAVAQVVERLRGFDLAKGELMILINVRPQTVSVLNACIEEIESRFSDEEQEEIIRIVTEVLGRFPEAEGEEAEGEEEGENEAEALPSVEM